MSSSGQYDPESDHYGSRPVFYIGQHDSARQAPLTDAQYRYVVDTGFDWLTSPITNGHFRQRVEKLYKDHLRERDQWGLDDDFKTNPSLPGPVVPTLTDRDTSLGPDTNFSGLAVAYSSPWIDLCSSNPIISSISRQVLNIEVAYAIFCGVRTVIIPGPRDDRSSRAIMQYARAVQEAVKAAPQLQFVIHLPMYREPGLEERAETLSSSLGTGDKTPSATREEIDIFTTWDTWHAVRSVCDYSPRLHVALRIPKRVPERNLQDRWFAEPIQYLSIGNTVFQKNAAGHPSLSRHHQTLIGRYMRGKQVPSLILTDVGPDTETLNNLPDPMAVEFPTPAEASGSAHLPPLNEHVGYLRYVERQQPPYSAMETYALRSFQDWLQAPLQPLADNLESATYEVFEGDPVKYNQYELAIANAMIEWKELKKPTSQSPDNSDLIVAVAGAGRGPLVTRVLKAAQSTGTAIRLWALEKNQNAYVYLLRQNKNVWNNQVTVVKTDMRGWEGPRVKGTDRISKVDILVSELLGSFGDNELSPECLDGIQRQIARPHGISIPHSYTAHLSPISHPRIFTDLSTRTSSSSNPFETPWVTRLFQLDFAAQKVPSHGRFQQAWEFVHPVEIARADQFAEKHGNAVKFTTEGGGNIFGSSGINDHNARHCHLTFVCPTRGVIHGLAGYFESVLYAPKRPGKEPVEISILPDQIDRKSKDMISWFPIFFPLKQPLYYPQDAEVEVSMWRQTDDAEVWYEWVVETYAWVGPKTRIKVAQSEMHSSKQVACRM